MTGSIPVDLSKYKNLFITESREHLEELTDNLLALENNPSEKTVMDEIFRHAHSIKGMASSMGYDIVEVLSHTMEDAMDVYRRGKAEITPEAIDELLAARDSLDVMVNRIEHEENPDFREGREAIERLKDWCRNNMPHFEDRSKPLPPSPDERPGKEEEEADRFGLFDGEVVPPGEAREMPSVPDRPDRHLKGGDSTGKSGWFITIKFKGETQAPAARAFLALKRIESLGEYTSQPSADEIKAGNFSGHLKVELETKSGIKQIREVLDGLTGVDQYQVEPLYPYENIPVYDEPETEPGQAALASAELPRTVRVSTRVLDNFVNMVGELLTVKSRLRDLAKKTGDNELDLRLDRLEGIIHELHSQVMDVRMMPLQMITSFLPRTVRDLARTSAKEVELVITGEDIELDRAILERLNDPLLHILRNSVDHGVEYPAERENLGKPRKGKISISAFREKDMIVIEIADDGKGIDTEAVKETAIAKGVIDAETAENLSHDDTLMLICMPGFSTSESVSFISGRGVGMDVVKSTIEDLGGQLRIHSQLGTGTRITLHLPRTVSILNVLLIEAGDEMFAVPIAKLLRTVEISPGDIRESQGGKMVMVEDEPMPLYSIREMMGKEQGEPEGDFLPALVIDHGRKPFVVTVDSFMGQEEAFIRPLGRPLLRVEGLSGVMTRGDGHPVFVLDIPNLRRGGTKQ